MVFPVPDSPKKTVVLPLCMSSLAEEWRQSWPLRGIMYIIRVCEGAGGSGGAGRDV